MLPNRKTYRCVTCRRTKSILEFPKNGRDKSGRVTLRPNCKKCHTADKATRYRLKHPDMVKRPTLRERKGEVYGKLTITSFAGYKLSARGRKVMMNCRCVCGQRKKIAYADLRCGKTKTCGLNHPHYEDRRIPAFNMIYRHAYKGRALKAGLTFTITPEQFMAISQQDCHYCGAPPTGNSYRNARGRGSYKSGKYVSQFTYNGLDRINSRRGYTLKNVVPCCGICNHAKHTMSYQDFVEWLDRIVKFHGVKP